MGLSISWRYFQVRGSHSATHRRRALGAAEDCWRGMIQVPFSSPGQLLRAVEFLQCRFRLERRGLAGEGLRSKYTDRRVGSSEFRPFATAVHGEAGCNIGRDAGVGPAIAAHEQI